MPSNALRAGFARQAANQSYGKAGLAAGTTTTQVAIATAFMYTINGVMYTRATSVSIVMTPLPIAVVPNATPFHIVGSTTVGLGLITAYMLLMVNAAGTLVFGLQSDEKGRDLSAFGRVDKGLGIVPDVPDVVPTATPLTDGFAPFGLIKLVVNNLQTFLPATDALVTGAKATVTFFDIGTVPGITSLV